MCAVDQSHHEAAVGSIGVNCLSHSGYGVGDDGGFECAVAKQHARHVADVAGQVEHLAVVEPQQGRHRHAAAKHVGMGECGIQAEEAAEVGTHDSGVVGTGEHAVIALYVRHYHVDEVTDEGGRLAAAHKVGHGVRDAVGHEAIDFDHDAAIDTGFLQQGCGGGSVPGVGAEEIIAGIVGTGGFIALLHTGVIEHRI